MAATMPSQRPPLLSLMGVDHTARPTWRLRETIEFYRDKLGLPLVHVISARGWGPSSAALMPRTPTAACAGSGPPGRM